MNEEVLHRAIIGCGYIGSEVARLWHKKGHHVSTTTRKSSRLEALSRISQKSLLLKGNDPEELIPLIASHPILIVTIAADSSDHYESAYLHTAQLFRKLALATDLPRILVYTSSSSVYGEHGGLWVDEASELKNTTAQGKILIEAEKTYLSLAELGWQVCILRFAEIYGPGRELSKKISHLHKHPLAGTGDAYTNMVHRTDCAHAIDFAIRHHFEGIYNVVDDDHPTRKELYDQISAQFNLPTVAWDPQLTSFHQGNKRVSNHKIKGAGFSFRYPHRVLD